MDTRPDPAHPQQMEKSIPVDAEDAGAEAQDVEMPRMRRLRKFDGKLERVAPPQERAVAASEPAASRLHLLELRQLRDTKRRRDVRHVVLVSQLDDVVAPGSSACVTLPRILGQTVQ